MTDREAAVQQVAEARLAAYSSRAGLTEAQQAKILHLFRQSAEVEAEGWWPLICQAREDGRREAAEAIELWRHDWLRGEGDDPPNLLLHAIHLARGAQQPGKENPDGQ